MMSGEKIKKALESLDESATHSYHLMDNLLHWTRSQLGKIEINKEVFDLRELIMENVNFARTALKYRNIDIHCNCSETLVEADKMMISTTLRNLISNAIKYTPEKGCIEIQSAIDNHKVRVSVRDTGIGIQSEEKEHIFDPLKKFSRTGLMNEKGSGIGLLLCKEFIEKNSGKLYFESMENKGTIFTFELPVKSKKDLHPGIRESSRIEMH
jgi:signal transduction histidine kinase